MPQTWRVIGKPHYIDRSADFLKRNLIAVGWGSVPNLTNRSRQQIDALVRKHTIEPIDGYGASVGQLNYIVNEIEIGDHVFMPASTSGEVHLGIILSEYRYSAKHRDRDDPTGERGFQHHRRVRWLFGKVPLPADDLPRELRSALRAHQAIVRVRGEHSGLFSRVDDEWAGERAKSKSEARQHSQDAADAYEEVAEGEPRLVVRLERLREARFRQAKIAQARRTGDGKLRCEVEGCGFDFEKVYGEIGTGFIVPSYR